MGAGGGEGVGAGGGGGGWCQRLDSRVAGRGRLCYINANESMRFSRGGLFISGPSVSVILASVN